MPKMVINPVLLQVLGIPSGLQSFPDLTGNNGVPVHGRGKVEVEVEVPDREGGGNRPTDREGKRKVGGELFTLTQRFHVVLLLLLILERFLRIFRYNVNVILLLMLG